MRSTLIMAAPLFLLAACASSGPRITTNSSPDADFSGFRTYDFMQPLSTDRPNGVRTPLSTMLIQSMTREMKSKGFEQSDTPDLLVNFLAILEERINVRSVPATSSPRGIRRGRYSTWGGYRTTVREYTRGTLGIDVVDATNNVLIWEGAAQSRSRRNVREVTQEQIDEIVRQLMAEFLPGAN